jgi:phosphonopyruvate decarboxylase
MIEPADVVALLEELGVALYTGVPDSLLKSFCAHIDEVLPPDKHVIAANEGGAIGIAMGHYLRTGSPALVYLQNSGFGNTVNPLLSLADPEVYGIPMVLLVGWRGQPGVPDEPQHRKQGRIMEDLLGALEVPWWSLPRDPSQLEACLREAVETTTERAVPCVIMVKKGTFASSADGGPRVGAGSALPSREEALIALVDVLGDGAITVSTTGMLSRELFEYRERTSASGELDFLTVGGMGHSCSIALGIALQEEDREVWCLDGDGAALMHLGSLAITARHAPANYFHVVFNNGVHDSVGGQPTAIDVVDLPEVARALGYRGSASCKELTFIPDRVAAMRQQAGPALLELQVKPGNRPGLGRPTRTPEESKRAFMAAVADQ